MEMWIVSHGFVCEKEADADDPRFLLSNDLHACNEVEASPIYRRVLLNRVVALLCVNYAQTDG